jgi:tetratricopeptide (TPR) repeat protein
MRAHVLCQRFTPLIFGVLILGLSGTLAGAAATVPASSERPQATKPSPMSMEQWRAAQEEADSAMQAPRGEQRIARCEAFIEAHPDYPGLDQVLQALIDAYVDTRKFDPAKLAALLERYSATRSLYGSSEPENLVDGYYFEYKLPLESAERLMEKARAGIAAQRQALARQPESTSRSEALSRLAMREARADVLAGRLLLAREKYDAALTMLLKAEAEATQSGQYGLSAQDVAGKTVRAFLDGSTGADWINLSLAQAYARTGNRQEAVRRLEQVRDFLPSFFPETGKASEALRRELSLPPPAPREVRAEARPAADFKLKDLGGKEVSLSDFKDRVVLVMYWATW